MTSGQLLVGAAVWAWVAALVLAPAFLKPLCGFICHQRPERSFFIAGSQLPVCARCLGLYVGAGVAVPLALLMTSPVPVLRARTTLLLAALPTAITWTLEVSGAAHFSNAVRFTSALPLGCAAAWLVLRVVGDD